MKPFLIVTILSTALACSHPAAKAPAAQKHYSLTGKVVQVDAKDGTAAIDAAAIPGYMEAMTMDYPIRSKQDLALLHPGDHITATINVGDDGAYDLSDIKVVPAAVKR